jgi:uncharacterized protein YecE (DUF72 family)
MARIHIGTSGFHYAHWVGPFYPSGTRPAQFLEHYLRHFDTVEINNTFYRLPTAAMLQSWVDATPEDFVFACKGSRFTTHVKRLADPPVAAQKFFDVIGTLGEKLGPILFQLPPRWSPNLERLETFLAWLRREHRYAFEFRDQSWFLPEVLALLRRYDIALCIYDFDGRRSPVEVTAPFAYVRLHGPGRRYHGSYSGPALSAWARHIDGWRRAGIDSYVYFDNDVAGAAALDALRLKRIVERRVGTPARSVAARSAPLAAG